MRPIFLFFLSIFSLSIATVQGQDKHRAWYFNFGGESLDSKYLPIDSTSVYNENAGYGFDYNTMPKFANSGKAKHLKNNYAYAKSPFYFSVKATEGNYKVTVLLGNYKKASKTTVKAESRRLMLENIITKKGKFIEKTFIVNIKGKKIDAERNVGLKERELSKLDWDEKLTLEFAIDPSVCALKIEPIDEQITVFLAGNSTVVNQEFEPWASWGQMIPRFFKEGVAIANHAESGLSLGSFLSSRRLEKILSVAKPGDYLFIEFGHNDQKERGENAGAYKSYSERLKLYVEEFRKKGGEAVILTSTSRRAFDEKGILLETLGDFPDAARKVAQELNVPLIDLNKQTRTFYETLGVEASKNALVHYPANTFIGQNTALADNTHFNTYGAYEISKMVLQGVVDNKLNIKKYIVDFKRYNASQPVLYADWQWPLSPKIDILKPDGN